MMILMKWLIKKITIWRSKKKGYQREVSSILRGILKKCQKTLLRLATCRNFKIKRQKWRKRRDLRLHGQIEWKFHLETSNTKLIILQISLVTTQTSTIKRLTIIMFSWCKEGYTKKKIKINFSRILKRFFFLLTVKTSLSKQLANQQTKEKYLYQIKAGVAWFDAVRWSLEMQFLHLLKN